MHARVPGLLVVSAAALTGCFNFGDAYRHYCADGGCAGGSGGDGGGAPTGGGSAGGGSAGGGAAGGAAGGGAAGGGAAGGGAAGGGAAGGGAAGGGAAGGGAGGGGAAGGGSGESCDASLCLAHQFLSGSTPVMWDVEGATASDVWMSGGGGTWVHWDGTSFTEGTIPLTGLGLYGVAITPSYVYMGGRDGVFRRSRAGGNWSSEALTSNAYLVNGMAAVSDSELFACGHSWAGRSDGGTWYDEIPGLDGGPDDVDYVDDVSAAYGQVYASGSLYWTGGGAIWSRQGPGEWNLEPVTSTTTSGEFMRMAFVSPTSLWAVSSDSTVVERLTDGGWKVHEKFTSANLQSIWGSSPTDIWVAGCAGNLWHWDGSGWTDHRSLFPSGLDLYGVWGSGKELFIVGAQPGVLSCNYGNDADGGWVYHFNRH